MSYIKLTQNREGNVYRFETSREEQRGANESTSEQSRLVYLEIFSLQTQTPRQQDGPIMRADRWETTGAAIYGGRCCGRDRGTSMRGKKM